MSEILSKQRQDALHLSEEVTSKAASAMKKEFEDEMTTERDGARKSKKKENGEAIFAEEGKKKGKKERQSGKEDEEHSAEPKLPNTKPSNDIKAQTGEC